MFTKPVAMFLKITWIQKTSSKNLDDDDDNLKSTFRPAHKIFTLLSSTREATGPGLMFENVVKAG